MTEKFATLNHFREHQTRGSRYNAVGMDHSGKFLFSDTELLFNELSKLHAEGERRIGLVQFSMTRKTKCFFDIDNLHDYTWEEVEVCIKNVVKHHYGTQDFGMLVLKNRKYEKYHLYFTKIILWKKQLKSLIETINQKLQVPVVDTSFSFEQNQQSLLRFEGFWKYSKKVPFVDVFEPDTDYILTTENQAFTTQFYQDTFLLIDNNVEITQMVRPLNTFLAPPINQFAVSSQNSQISGMNLFVNDEEMENRRLYSNNHNMVIVTDATTLRQREPALAAIVEKYPIRSYQETSNCFIFDCDKSREGRKCPNLNIIHEQNNSYLLYFKNGGQLYHKCRKKECENVNKLVWRKPRSSHQFRLSPAPPGSEENDGDAFISTSDDNLSRLFAEIYGEVWCCRTVGKDRVFLQHNGITWKTDKNQSELRLLLGNQFPECLRNQCDEQLRNGKVTADACLKAKRVITQRLETYSKKTSIANTLSDYLHTSEEFDVDPRKFVTLNGVFDFSEFNDDEAFGSTEPEEMISDTYHAPFIYKPESECAEDVAKLRMISHQILTDDETYDTYLGYISTAMYGKRIKSFAYCFGLNGNNGKSWMTSMTLALLGTMANNYGTTASADMFQGSKGDRASIAALNEKRLVVAEELKDDLAINGNLVKLFTGCDVYNARGFNSGRTQNISRMCLIFNMNKEVDIYPCDGAVRDRMLHIKFESEYVRTDEEVDEARHKYKRNTLYMEPQWQNDMRAAWFHVLKPYLRKFLTGGQVIRLPAKLQQSRDDLLNGCNEFHNWFFQIIEFTGNGKEGIAIQHLERIFKESQYYHQLTKSQQRKSVRKRLVREIQAHSELNKAYFERKMIDGTTFKRIVVGYQYKDPIMRQQYSFRSMSVAPCGSRRLLADTDIEQNEDSQPPRQRRRLSSNHNQHGSQPQRRRTLSSKSPRTYIS